MTPAMGTTNSMIHIHYELHDRLSFEPCNIEIYFEVSLITSLSVKCGGLINLRYVRINSRLAVTITLSYLKSVDFFNISKLLAAAVLPSILLMLFWCLMTLCHSPHLLIVSRGWNTHYNDVIIGVMASQITSLTIFYSTIYLGADRKIHQSSSSLAFVRGIHCWPLNSPHKWPVTRILFPNWWRHHEIDNWHTV